ncbi:Neural cell adhesion molecule L1 [Geodia barretti]|uniref:Neural cell adhesion molecule L1 n=1 Tax=Geodia barretti TaxID=519541 RepID=A0AA35WEL5_GEOBA|nr:Neural cell adhesion molecule L1 [Geodia barretti]
MVMVAVTVVVGGGTYDYGVDVTLTCRVSDIDPPHNVTWQVPESSTSLERGMLVNNINRSTLTFEVRKEDEGCYTCQVVGSTGQEQIAATVTVDPAILMGPEDMILEYSDVLTATFTCTAFGGDNAPLTIDWLAPSDVTGLNISSKTEDINADNSTTSSITTLPLSLSDRGSMYTCDVTYEGAPSDDTEASASVDIVPAITEDPQSIFVGVGLGRNATFSCSAYGGPTEAIPSLEFTWTGPAGIDVSIQVTEMVNDIATSTLTLVNVTEDFEGNYSCSVAYSDMQMITSISEIATLSAVRDPPVITEPPIDSVEERGNSITFSCTAVGNGTLNITWRLPSGEVVFSGQDMEEIWRVNSSLTVTDISATDGGNYSCIAENEAGAVEATASLCCSIC